MKKYIKILCTYIIMNIICNIIFRSVWLGPDGGVLIGYLPTSLDYAIMFLSIILQMLVLIVYYKIGKKMYDDKKMVLITAVGIAIVNVICLMMLYLFNGSIEVSVKNVSLWSNSSLLLLSILTHKSIIFDIIYLFLPSALILGGYIWESRGRLV